MRAVKKIRRRAETPRLTRLYVQPLRTCLARSRFHPSRSRGHITVITAANCAFWEKFIIWRVVHQYAQDVQAHAVTKKKMLRELLV